MKCPYCKLSTIRKRAKKTELGYATFFCSTCRRNFNERIGTTFNYLEFSTDIVLLVVFWRLRYKLSLRDLAEMFLERGFLFTHEAVRNWEARFAPLLAHQLRTKRHGQAGKSWYVDETYLKVHGNRSIKQRYYPMRGFGNVTSATRFCRAFDEVRQFFRVRTTMKQKVSLAQQREVFRQRLDTLKTLALVM